MQEIPIDYNYDNQEVEIELNEVIYDKNKIDSISVNGVIQTIDENKNVDITIPTKLSDLSNDNNTVQDANYVHTDNNYTAEEKTKLASLENYDDTEVKETISGIQYDISNLNTDITDLNTNKADKTEIPTTLAELNDDSTHRVVTDTQISNWNNKSEFSGNYNDLTNKPSIPSKTSDLTNDSGFITNAVNNLVNYYKTSETYTQSEVNSLISAISTMNMQVVQTLPTQDISTTTIYLVPRTTSETNNIYDEYIYVSNSWEKIGSTDVDLSGYQPLLTAGSNINISNGTISATDTTYTAGTGIDITNGVISNTQTSAEWGNITGTLSNQTDLNTALGNKQNTLVSGTNIKTINNESILGSGNIEIQGGSGGNEIYIGDEEDAPESTKLLIDEEDIDWNGSEVVNTLEGNETNKAPSVNAVNNKLEEMTTYSTDEQVVGTWIDGEPLYRRVLTGTLPTDVNFYTLIEDVSYYNIQNCIIGADLRPYEYFILSSNNSGALDFVLLNGDLQIRSRSSTVFGFPYIAVIEYTKTTN